MLISGAVEVIVAVVADGTLKGIGSSRAVGMMLGMRIFARGSEVGYRSLWMMRSRSRSRSRERPTAKLTRRPDAVAERGDAR